MNADPILLADKSVEPHHRAWGDPVEYLANKLGNNSFVTLENKWRVGNKTVYEVRSASYGWREYISYYTDPVDASFNSAAL